MILINKLKIYYITCFFCCLSIIGFGQVSFTASVDKTQVAVGEPFQLVIKLTCPENSNISEIDAKSSGNLSVIGNYDFTSQNLKGITAVRQMSLMAKANENHTLIASVVVNGKRYTTKPIVVKAGKGGSPAKPAISPNTTASQPQIQSSNPYAVDSDDSQGTKFIISTQQFSPYVGQEVIVTLRVLSKSNRLSPQSLGMGDMSNFNVREIDVPNNTGGRESYKGSVYNSWVIKQFGITPKKSGQLIMPPMVLRLPQLVTTRDVFGDWVQANVMVDLNSNQLVFNVKDLPIQGKPKNFSGAVGNFNLVVQSNKKKVKAGETINASVEIVGKGNLKAIAVPKIELDPALEVYNTENKDNTNSTGGSIGTDYTIIPQYKGNYQIPSLSFSFFNPELGQYITKSSQPIPIEVTTGAERPKDLEKIVASKANTKTEVADNAPILHFQPLKEKFTTQNHWFSDMFLWFIMLLSIIMIPVIVILYRKKQNYQETKAKDPYQWVKKYVEEARQYLVVEDSTAFYTAIENALFWFLSDKFKMNRTDFSINNIEQKLREKSVAETKIAQIQQILTVCNTQKYAPMQSQHSQKEILNQTVELIKNF